MKYVKRQTDTTQCVHVIARRTENFYTLILLKHVSEGQPESVESALILGSYT
jgi:hypothetical protein